MSLSGLWQPLSFHTLSQWASCLWYPYRWCQLSACGSDRGFKGFRCNLAPFYKRNDRVNKLLIICIFPLPVLELPSHQQLSRNPGASVHEGGGKEIMEEGLHVSAALRALLFYKRNLKGNGGSLHSSQTRNTVHLKCNLLERNSVLLTAELHTPLSVRVPPGCLLSDILIY